MPPPPKTQPVGPPKPDRTQPNNQTKNDKDESSDSEDFQETQSVTSVVNDSETQKATEKMIQDINQGNDIDFNVGFKAIFGALFENGSSRIKRLEDNVEACEATVDAMEASLGRQQTEINGNTDHILTMQITMYKYRYLLRNLPIHREVKRGKEENAKQTMEVIKDLFNDMKLKNLDFPDCFRFATNKDKKDKTKIPTISATFMTGTQVAKFFANLNKLQDMKKYSKFRVEKEYPPLLVPDFLRAAEKAAEIRKNQKLETRVKIVKRQVKLFTAKKGTKEFKTEVEY